ncbi:hypothetical protein Taro_025823 [Colocasia esculenta]|uniref:RPAP1 N-terminal domain-containing protein n=1 Tax=Colocasia esculenta TaxID=4460 RepID=A0A843VHP2_COLES|nr:hypothetical protein [Colocasia esculenta]
MEAENTNGAAPSFRKVSGVRPRKVEEQHHGATLVGRIVEKGFSPSQPGATTTSFPRPTVLSFPHWAPVATAMDVDEDEAEEDKDPLDYGSAASFARPIQKREKKDLDFSRWKQLAAFESSASPSKVRKKHESAAIPRPTEQYKAGALATSAVAEGGFIREEASKLSSPATETTLPGHATREPQADFRVELNKDGKSNQGDEKCLPRHEPTAMDVEPQLFGSVASRRGNSTIMDDIDAENLARLRQMSPQEIAEAQTEIMEKMNPAILETLKKRGQQKRGNRRAPPAEEKERGRQYGVKQVEGASSFHQTKVTKVEGLENFRNMETKQVEAASSSQKMESKPSYGEWLSSGASQSSSWKAWCERVEKVRDLRFTLDGNVVEDDPSQEPRHGRLQYILTTCIILRQREMLRCFHFVKTKCNAS